MAWCRSRGSKFAKIRTAHGVYTFDFLIISTGLVSDPALRPELRLVEEHIARWKDCYEAPPELRNEQIDAHPYLSPGFAMTSKSEQERRRMDYSYLIIQRWQAAVYLPRPYRELKGLYPNWSQE